MAANSSGDAFLMCLLSGPMSVVFTAVISAKLVLLLPLCVVTLALGLRRWAERRSCASECVTHHMVFMQLSGAAGYVLWINSVRRMEVAAAVVGYNMFVFTWFGEMLFHMVTCLERYLAVVHPLTYRRLQSRRGTRIRSGSVAAVWLVCFAAMAAISLLRLSLLILILDMVLLVSCLAVVSFCSLSVLCMLLRPGPGERGVAKERSDQAKRRAFYTILLVLAVLLIWFAGNLLWFGSLLSNSGAQCEIMVSQIFFTVPSSLLPPLLYLHREGKLARRGKSAQ